MKCNMDSLMPLRPLSLSSLMTKSRARKSQGLEFKSSSSLTSCLTLSRWHDLSRPQVPPFLNVHIISAVTFSSRFLQSRRGRGPRAPSGEEGRRPEVEQERVSEEKRVGALHLLRKGLSCLE